MLVDAFRRILWDCTKSKAQAQKASQSTTFEESTLAKWTTRSLWCRPCTTHAAHRPYRFMSELNFELDRLNITWTVEKPLDEFNVANKLLG